MTDHLSAALTRMRLSLDGRGSFGNGGAMRIAPLGAFFADDVERVVVEARRAREVTHAHPEAVARAVAVAVAAALEAVARAGSTAVVGM
jgi:ADP-ribosylglycohydrolase